MHSTHAVTNTGTAATWTGTILTENTNTITNAGTMTATSPAAMGANFVSCTPAAFVTSPTRRASDLATVGLTAGCAQAASFHNTGTANVNGGTFDIGGGSGGSEGGAFNVASGTTLRFSGPGGNTNTLSATSTITGLGTVSFTGSTTTD